MRRRLKLEIHGSVQGVGFRPFVYRLAGELGLDGWVANDTRGVLIEVEGDPCDLETFAQGVESRAPRAAAIETLDRIWVEPVGAAGFEIRHSDRGGRKTVQVLPDIATCEACLGEVRDARDRRHAYPFANCTQCGPRFSILRSLPYDRPRTTMAGFTLCGPCLEEYRDPDNRRFHAQPNACPDCGPQLELRDADGKTVCRAAEALGAAADELVSGRIVAVKGLGGFHLMADARNEEAVARLRRAKPRREKPFALMVPDLDHARALCRLDEDTARALTAPEAPIVLVARRAEALIAEGVAPGNPCLGLMLPYTPLHHLLLDRLGFPLVATSGNLSDEPICTDESEAAIRLNGVADRFLVHDRPIARHVDDSVAWSVSGKLRLLRRARGYAPRPVLQRTELPVILALGAHLKNTVALSVGPRIFVSQHIGDMETSEALEAFERVIDDFLRLYEARPVALVHDLHPDYASTRWAREVVEDAGPARRALQVLHGLCRIGVQHHHAHLASCLAEHDLAGPALGVIWDGTGYGTDGIVWGGEFLVGDCSEFRRFASLRPFRLPGGEAAVREPRRAALALLWELEGEAVFALETLAPVRAFEMHERRLIGGMLGGGTASPWATSMGRLFDAVAALTGLRQRNTFEGQAAMALEHVADPAEREAYRLELTPASETEAGAMPDAPSWIVDWAPMLRRVIDDLDSANDVARIAARFHNGLVEALLAVARRAGQRRVVLSGGCFQNRLLVQRSIERLREEGFQPLIHRQVPPNDGGISLGQVRIAACRLRRDD